MGAPRRVAALSAVLALAWFAAAAAEDGGTCNTWDLSAVCSTDASRVGAGEPFNATITVRNAGDMPLVNVVLMLRGDLGARPTGDAPNPVQRVVERLEPGDSRDFSAAFVSDQVGVARIIGSTRDQIGWSGAGCACTVEVMGLPALGGQIADRRLPDATGIDGMFLVGETFRYVLTVSNDQGTAPTPDLKVVFSLPKELEFAGGSGERGVTVTGSAQTATTSSFVVGPKERTQVELRVKVLAAPPSNLVMTRASVQTVTGIELIQLSESTTLR
jgi:hypothetical protein